MLEDKLQGIKCRNVVLNIKSLRLWDEENFYVIVDRFRRVIEPFDKIFSRKDYSIGKVSVLTSFKNKINEEMAITVERKTFTVGVVKHINDWSPFHPVSLNKFEEESDGDDVDVDDIEAEEEDDISDTWMEAGINDLEEGEIHPEIPEMRCPVAEVKEHRSSGCC
ncbi:unnamed protein product [Lactuca virosa]|uniref:DUF4283 domain-containing protein n=1 Tax=Lactuca virosa TaxID=75947 RepID=A0AAU9NP02_9ASTR|nr:unnamed protein product [Lactuca virosa]